MIGHRKNIIEEWKEFLYPRRCPGCNEILYEEEKPDGYCRRCKTKIRYIGDGGCIKCGKKLKDATQTICSDCRRRNHAYVQNKAVYVYTGPMKLAMYRFKYSNCRTYGKTFVEDVWKMHAIWLQNLSVDAVVPVPMYRKKEKRRGYNQAEVLAHGIAQKLGCPLETKLVVRAKNTVPLKNLNDTQRKKNLEKAFKIRKNGVKLNKILLIDDIYTTGSTLDGVTTALLAAGVREVYCLTICAGQG